MTTPDELTKFFEKQLEQRLRERPVTSAEFESLQDKLFPLLCVLLGAVSVMRATPEERARVDKRVVILTKAAVERAERDKVDLFAALLRIIEEGALE